MSEKIGITIVGAGVIGCAVAYEISKVYQGDIVVIEKNPQVSGENQSSRNSGVVHAGIYYPKEFSPLKAKLCVEGNRMLFEFCKKHNILCRKTGKLVIAVKEMEIEYLEDVERIAKENGVSVKPLLRNEIKKLEPNVDGIAALYVPSSGIIEPTSLVDKLYKLAEGNGVIFLTGNTIEDISSENDYFRLKISSRSFSEEFITGIFINCAGLYSDIITRMLIPEKDYEIEPIKGDSARFYCTRRDNINMNGLNVYPVPAGYFHDGEKAEVSFKEFMELYKQNKVTKSVGVHLSPAFDTGAVQDSMKLKMNSEPVFAVNTITMGPAYSKPKNREDYSNSREIDYFYKMVKPFFPNIEIDDIGLHQTGIRAKLKNHHDFVIERDSNYPNFINLVGIDSPGLTSSLAIAEYVKNLAGDLL